MNEETFFKSSRNGIGARNTCCDLCRTCFCCRQLSYELFHLLQGMITEHARSGAVLFLGFDEKGDLKHCCSRETDGSSGKKDMAGSDKRYAFKIASNDENLTVRVFESAIDLLSYATMLKEIRRLKKRIEELSIAKETDYVGWEFEGGEVVPNKENCRLQIFFDEKPDEEKRSALKMRGFHWSPTEGAWQRQLNSNAIYATDRLEFLKPLDGHRPSELQPKVNVRDKGGEAR